MKWQHRKCKHCINCQEYKNKFGQKRFRCIIDIVEIDPDTPVILLDCQNYKQINFKWEKSRKRQLKALNRPLRSNILR